MISQSDYLKWLEEEIKVREKYNFRTSAWKECRILKVVKEKFLTIQYPSPPSVVDEKRKAAIQNGFDDYCEAHDLPYRNECPLCPPLTDELPENPSNFTDGLT